MAGVLRILVRRFRCAEPRCPRVVFAERLGAIERVYARTATAVAEAHTAIGFTAWGEPGARLAQTLAMPTSPDTVLRRIKAADLTPGPPPRSVGVDDGAIRKDQHYGTMAVDLERQRAVPLSRAGSRA